MLYNCYPFRQHNNQLAKLATQVYNRLVTMAELMKDRRVFLSTTIYGVSGFAVIIINEVRAIF